MSKDRIYAEAQATTAPFQFDETWPMYSPTWCPAQYRGYDLTLTMIGVLGAHYARPETVCFDLGCALGASTLALRNNVPESCHIVAVDNSPAMTQGCAERINTNAGGPRVDIICADLQSLIYANASLITLNFTLQFIASSQREPLLRRLQRGMIDGGALILSEKIALPGEGEQNLFEHLHHDFKHAMGYSRLEIARKRAALEQVLVPDSVDTHKERLHRAGFSEVYTWFQCFNFVSLLAVK